MREVVLAIKIRRQRCLGCNDQRYGSKDAGRAGGREGDTARARAVWQSGKRQEGWEDQKARGQAAATMREARRESRALRSHRGRLLFTFTAALSELR